MKEGEQEEQEEEEEDGGGRREDGGGRRRRFNLGRMFVLRTPLPGRPAASGSRPGP